MSWDKWHKDPREGEEPEEPTYEPTGRVLSPAEMSAELRRIFAKVLERIERDDEEMGVAQAARFDKEPR